MVDDYHALKKFDEVKKWIAGKPASTQGTYLIAFNIYVKYRKLNPKQLIDEIEIDRKKSRREMGEVEVKVKNFYNWLLTDKKKIRGGYHPKETGIKGISPNRASSIITSVRSFYRVNGFPLTLKSPRSYSKKENIKLRLRADHVKKLVDHAPTLRDSAIILMLFQTGMDVSTLCSLDYGDVSRGLQENKCPLPIHVVRKKKNIEYTTFLGRDGIDSLKAYLNKRIKKGGKLKLTDPLFVKEKNYNGKKRMARALIEKMLREVAIISGLVNKEEMERADINPCRPHALRGAFSSIMKLEGVNNDIVEYWMGHSVPYESAYLIPEEEELQRIYREHEESLSINRSIEQVKKLEKKYNGKMETYDEIINRQAQEIEKLKHSQGQILGDNLIKVLENNPKLTEQIVEVLARKLEEKRKKA